MNSAKKARLEGAGWKVGTAAEFLGLNKQEAAFVEMKLALARCLHALRIRRKLTQSRVAELVGSSQSRVAKMESGDPSVSVDLLLRSVLAIGGSPTEVVRALASRRPDSTDRLSGESTRTACKHFASVSPDTSGHRCQTDRAPMLVGTPLPVNLSVFVALGPLWIWCAVVVSGGAGLVVLKRPKLWRTPLAAVAA